MSRLRLKFPDRGQTVPRIDFSVLLIGLLLLAGVFLQFRQVTEEVNFWTHRVERLEKQQQQKAAPRTRAAPRIKEIGQEIRKEIIQANTILDQINLPWEALFDAIEQAATEEIALLSLQPNVSSLTVRIGGEARSMSELLDFVEALERESVFDKVHLLNYKIKQDNPHRPVVFLLTAAWIQTS